MKKFGCARSRSERMGIAGGVGTIVLLSVIVVAAVVGGYIVTNKSLDVTSATTTSETNLPHSVIISNYVTGPNCSSIDHGGISIAQNINENSTRLLTFSMQAGSTATLCVEYHVMNDTSRMLPSTVYFFMYLQAVSATAIDQAGQVMGYSYSYQTVTGFQATASPSEFDIPSGFSPKESIIVNYTITATSSASGLYTFTFTNMCPPLIPLSVGYATAQLSPALFPGFFFPASCGARAPLGNATIVGYGGMGTEWISQ